ncbi:MAG: hypothetical protein AAFU54_30895, partial [Chloroflexota bacterium]
RAFFLFGLVTFEDTSLLNLVHMGHNEPCPCTGGPTPATLPPLTIQFLSCLTLTVVENTLHSGKSAFLAQNRPDSGKIYNLIFY